VNQRKWRLLGIRSFAPLTIVFAVIYSSITSRAM
jgi:hypothetical protein